ncbi:acyl-CoA dehydrogenase family protein [Protofrankia symbiont of Coriaria ruscifolia]|uniref:acyl-CoA dehydrogenase family protein n=1 Tax=Protofrankia symbiont of Coriaria ruscifolia TaxID=1306542 RepID=UPI0010416EC5|nr:acyl-CoA dehydrogenase family protein [Protofrankia symbiont of Coriaria ruscifolia]
MSDIHVPAAYGVPANHAVPTSRDVLSTHEVVNQVPPLVGYDAFTTDTALVEAVHRHGAGWAVDELSALGRLAGSARAREWGEAANLYPPELHTHDRYGYRVDEVRFHPAYHELMTVAVRSGIAGGPWRNPIPGAHVARAAAMMIWSQVDAGHTCPISMTYAAVPALRVDPDLAARWEPLLTAPHYDPGLRPSAAKAGVLAGMAMTEKQGGSDVRANLTRAVRRSGDDGTYAITGHKWFCSAPMNDVFCVLAQAPGGLSCFVVPRVLPDGTRNVFRLQRLKDKLGNRSNASSEVEFAGTTGWLLGEEGRGVATIVEMVALTRLDCVLGTAALMRFGVAQALHHAAHRRAFGRYVLDAPLARNVLADLAVEAEAALVLGIRLAATLDSRPARPAGGASTGGAAPADSERAIRRFGTAVAKFHVCKRGPSHLAEALECLGGNGYVEESGMPRAYREAPLNSLWEGTGNINALDVLRAMGREPGCVEAFDDEIDAVAGSDRRLDEAARSLRRELAAVDEYGARRLVERMALVLQAALLVRYSTPAVADAFCASRLEGGGGYAFGTLPAGLDLTAILERHRPKL